MKEKGYTKSIMGWLSTVFTSEKWIGDYLKLMWRTFYEKEMGTVLTSSKNESISFVEQKDRPSVFQSPKLDSLLTSLRDNQTIFSLVISYIVDAVLCSLLHPDLR